LNTSFRENGMIVDLRQLMESRVNEHPGKAFIIEPNTGKTLTYKLFSQEVYHFADILQQNGFQAGDRSLLMLRNGSRFAVAFFAVIMLDGIAVPVNPALKQKELAYLIEDSESAFILTNEEFENVAEGFAHNPVKTETGIRIYRLEKKPENENSEKPFALLLYTSGTTGKPKGVMLTQENLIATASYIYEAHELTEDDTVLCVLPYFHINGLVVTLITPVYAGLTIILPEKFSASAFWGWIDRYKASWFSAVPTIYSFILDKPTDEYNLSSLKFARSASSPLPVAVLHEFERKTGVPIIESFGISEGGSQITANPRPPKTRKAGSVGLPFGNEIRVVDEHGGVLPALQTGEVVVRGANIARGYYHKPEETQSSFVDGWFHTGDLGHFDEDGYLYLEGRMKELINRAGEKFSPKEIDEALYKLPQVELAAAVGVPHDLYGEEVAAYVKLRDGQSISAEQIRIHCRNELADYKVPKEIFFVEDLPRGPSGKIQRLKLLDVYVECIV